MASRSRKGLVHIYTGSGKGKTTAAIGLAIRASGAGMKVYMQQFLKNADCSEIRALSRIDGIKLERCGRGCFIKGKPKPEDLERAQDGFRRAEKAISSGKYGLAILDEVNVAMDIGLLCKKDVAGLISKKPASVELVLTGRRCPADIIGMADLVTEMKKIRHPFDKGIPARRGIEY